MRMHKPVELYYSFTPKYIYTNAIKIHFSNAYFTNLIVFLGISSFNTLMILQKYTRIYGRQDLAILH